MALIFFGVLAVGRGCTLSLTPVVVVVSAVGRSIITSRGSFDRRGVAPRVYGRRGLQSRSTRLAEEFNDAEKERGNSDVGRAARY